MPTYSFQYYYNINEAAKIEIEQIENLKDDKLFVSVGGGIGAGKTFLTKKFITLPILDVDDYVTQVSSGTYDRANLAAGRKKFNEALMKAFEGNESFVHMGTNANLNGATNRLQMAKQNGFTTVLVLIDTSPEKALQQIQGRTEREEISKERIVQTHNESVEVFKTLIKDNHLVDFYVHVQR